MDMHHQAAAAVSLDVVVGGVMRDMAVDHPHPRLQGFPHDAISLSGADVQRVGKKPLCRREGFTITCHDEERTAVDVHRMDETAV